MQLKRCSRRGRSFINDYLGTDRSNKKAIQQAQSNSFLVVSLVRSVNLVEREFPQSAG